MRVRRDWPTLRETKTEGETGRQRQNETDRDKVTQTQRDRKTDRQRDLPVNNVHLRGKQDDGQTVVIFAVAKSATEQVNHGVHAFTHELKVLLLDTARGIQDQEKVTWLV